MTSLPRFPCLRIYFSTIVFITTRWYKSIWVLLIELFVKLNWPSSGNRWAHKVRISAHYCERTIKACAANILFSSFLTYLTFLLDIYYTDFQESRALWFDVHFIMLRIPNVGWFVGYIKPHIVFQTNTVRHEKESIIIEARFLYFNFSSVCLWSSDQIYNWVYILKHIVVNN